MDKLIEKIEATPEKLIIEDNVIGTKYVNGNYDIWYVKHLTDINFLFPLEGQKFGERLYIY